MTHHQLEYPHRPSGNQYFSSSTVDTEFAGLDWNQYLSSYSVFEGNLINSFKTVSKTLLDVGCGTGSFICHANKRLWNVTGIEPNLKARSNCDPDIKSFVFDTKELDRLSKSSFDVITLWHVMEHIYNLEEQMLIKALQFFHLLFVVLQVVGTIRKRSKVE